MKLSVRELILEVTRRCNMACAHCMRGDAQNKDMTRELIDKVFENITNVGTITFTGGEPTLNTDIIQYTLDVCKKKSIDVYEFYIVTNGKAVPEEFLIACLRWHAYTIQCSGEDEFSGVALSQDMFHEQIPAENIALLHTLACFRPEDKHTDFMKYGVNPIGRASALTNVPANTYKHQTLPDSFISDRNDDEIEIESMTVTVNGDILSDCDYDYDNIEQITVGNISDPQWLEKHISAYCDES